MTEREHILPAPGSPRQFFKHLRGGVYVCTMYEKKKMESVLKRLCGGMQWKVCNCLVCICSVYVSMCIRMNFYTYV
jgi:hypothetical protein